MSFFHYRDGELHVEDVAVGKIAGQVGTPFYCYSSAAIADAYDTYAAALRGLPATICYSLKSNNNLAVVRTLAARGAGADVVSEGELYCARAAGVPANKIVFAGVGKAAREMAAGLEANILQFNVESSAELRVLNEVAQSRGVRAPVALRINPDVDARTHAKISTGMAENKFGIELSRARAVFTEAAAMPGVDISGLAVHIGSQLTELEPYRHAFDRIAGLTVELRKAGFAVRRLDLGGGLGIAYGDEASPSLETYADIVQSTVGPLGLPLIFEPGRRIVGNAGVLVTQVIYVKHGVSRNFVIVDAAMNDLIRPALYEAYHDFVPAKEPADDAASQRVDIVGPVCESADIFAEQRPMPPVAAGDFLVIRSTGAYGAVMASSYNLRLPAPEVMVRGNDYAIVRPRPTYEDIIGRDRLPGWLGESDDTAQTGRMRRRSR